MHRNRYPDILDIGIADPELAEVLGGGIGAADFKPLRAVVLGCTSHVVEETGDEEEGETVGSYPGGVCALGEGLGVEVDSEAVVENCGWEALLDEVVGARAHRGWWDYVGRIDCRGIGDGRVRAGSKR